VTAAHVRGCTVVPELAHNYVVAIRQCNGLEHAKADLIAGLIADEAVRS
jgi:hypothetical protein